MTDNFAFKDQFAKHLGAEILEIKDGYAKVQLKVQKYFLNGVHTAHGGVLFSLADYAFALAANTTGETGVAINVSIQFIKPAFEDEVIVAEAKMISRSKRLGTFSGSILNQKKEILAYFNAMAYYKVPKIKE